MELDGISKKKWLKQHSDQNDENLIAVNNK